VTCQISHVNYRATTTRTFTNVPDTLVSSNLLCVSSDSQPTLCRRYRGLPRPVFPFHHPQVSSHTCHLCSVEGMRKQCPLPEDRPLQTRCLILPVSGVSVDLYTFLITLPLLLPSRRPETPQSQVFWKGFSHFFFLVDWRSLGAPDDEPTNSLLGVHPTVTDEPTVEPSREYSKSPPPL